MCVLYRSITGFSVVLRPPFLPFSHDISWKQYCVSLMFLSWFFFPLYVVPDGNVYPPASAVCACLERFPSRLYGACISRTYTVPLLRSCNAGFVFFLLVISGHAFSLVVIAVHSKRPTVSAFSPFHCKTSVRERLVRSLPLDPTVSRKFYLVGTSRVSVIASWIYKVPPYSLSIIEAPKTFSRSSMPSVFFVAFKVWHSFVFG